MVLAKALSERRQSNDRARVRDELFAAEKSLTDPEVRSTRSSVEELLHPDFVETGSSGEVYVRGQMIEMMLTEAPGRIVIRDFEVELLADDVALVRYRSVGAGGQEARRTSIWMRDDQTWRLRHHQGTRVPDGWGGIS